MTKLLILSPFPPRLDASHGGARAIAGLLTRLAADHRVALLTLRAHDQPPTGPEVASACELVVEVERVVARSSPSAAWRERQRLALVLRRAPGWAVGFSVRAFALELERVVARWRPDVVQIEYVIMGQYARALGDRPFVLVDHDASDGLPGMLRFRAATAKAADAVVTFTERDRAAVARLAPGTRVVRIPLAVDLPAASLDARGNGRDVLFVGNFEHRPNVEAAIRLARGIFPRVAESVPSARLVLVGADPPKELRALASEKVVVTGHVADLDPLLDAAAVVAAPLASGGGMRVKVLEALAAGKAVIATPLALEGLDVSPGSQVVVAVDDRMFADEIVMLLRDGQRRVELGSAARAWAEANVDWRRSSEAYASLYSSLLAEREPPGSST